MAATPCRPPPPAFTASAQEIEVRGPYSVASDHCTPTPVSGEAARVTRVLVILYGHARPAGGPHHPPAWCRGAASVPAWLCRAGPPSRVLSTVILGAEKEGTPRGSLYETEMAGACRAGPLLPHRTVARQLDTTAHLPRPRSPRLPAWSALGAAKMDRKASQDAGLGRVHRAPEPELRLRRPAARQVAVCRSVGLLNRPPLQMPKPTESARATLFRCVVL